MRARGLGGALGGLRLVPAEGGVGRPLGRVRDDGRVRVLMPLPDRDFDVTEVAVPWRVLRGAGCVVFATEQAGTVPAADPRLLTGVIFGRLGAAREAKRCYAELATAAEFTSTQAWGAVDPAAFGGLLLPGARKHTQSGRGAFQRKVAMDTYAGRPPAQWSKPRDRRPASEALLPLTYPPFCTLGRRHDRP